MTERCKLEEQLHPARRMEAVGRLAGGITHDFNNLLTIAEMSTEMLLARIPEDSSLRADLVATREAGARAASYSRSVARRSSSPSRALRAVLHDQGSR